MAIALPHLNIATIGHYEHGKTTLCAAITHALSSKSSTVRAMKVKDIAKGSIPRVVGWNETVQVNHVGYPIHGFDVSHADCPGRRGYLRNTARGMHLIDVVVLVISADQGVMAQSREHLIAARGAGVANVVVFLGKCDLVRAPDELDLVESEAREMISDCGYVGDEVRIVRGAALPALHGDPAWSPTIVDLIEALDREVPVPARDPDGPALFAIDHLFTSVRLREGTDLNYRVGGMLHQGRLHLGNKLEVLSPEMGSPIATAQILEMEVYHQRRTEALAGENVGLTLHILTKAERYARRTLRRALLVTPSSQTRTTRVACDLRVLTQREGGRHTPFHTGHQPTVYVRHEALQARVELPAGHPGAHPGELVQGVVLTFSRPIVITTDKTFSLADGTDGLRQQHGGDPRWGGLFATGRVTALLPDLPRE